MTARREDPQARMATLHAVWNWRTVNAMGKTRRKTATVINISQFIRLMREKRGTRGYRPTAQEIGMNFCTYRRIEQEGRVPDIDTFVRICHWLRHPVEDFVFKRLL